MNPQPHRDKLPARYRLESMLTGAGKTWQVSRTSDGHKITCGQKTPKAAVDLALQRIAELSQK